MEPNNKEIYTVTIVRNFGVPLSFTIAKRKVALLTFIAALLVGFLLFAAVDFLVLRSQNTKVKHQLSIAEGKVKVLIEQARVVDQQVYGAGQIDSGRSQYKKQVTEQPEFSTQNLWEQARGSLSDAELQEGSAVDIDKFSAHVKGDLLSLAVTMVNRSNPDQSIGGYLCVTLINEDDSPVSYKSATGGALGEHGYPSSYKFGRQYFIKNRGAKRSIHQSLALKETNEYYTSAVLFVYSYKGTLLNRSVHRLNKSIFLE